VSTRIEVRRHQLVVMITGVKVGLVVVHRLYPVFVASLALQLVGGWRQCRFWRVWEVRWGEEVGVCVATRGSHGRNPLWYEVSVLPVCSLWIGTDMLAPAVLLRLEKVPARCSNRLLESATGSNGEDAHLHKTAQSYPIS
jgi:hypothetical protein